MKTNCEACGSSDANEVYDDGHTHCFSCNKTVFPKEPVDEPTTTTYYPSNINMVPDINTYRSYPISSRGISLEIVDEFKVKMSVSPEGKPSSHFYPYTKDGQTVAYKERKLPKDFRVHGDFKDVELFGQSNARNSRTLVVTEGELDALAVAQAYASTKYKPQAVVSLPSASGISTLLAQRDWVNTFETVVLMFDQDDAGQKAIDKAAKIIKAGKCKIAKLKEKDPCEELNQHGSMAILEAVWNAQPWNPSGILVGETIWEKFQERQAVESIPYPVCLAGLNEKLGGMRHGEITLFTSGTGSGKSTVIKEIVLDLLATTDDKIGLISLEESIGDTAEKFISMALKRSLMDPPPLTEQQVREGFDSVFGDERLVLLDHQGSVSDSSLLDKIEYMALMGCKYLILDHITIAVSEGSDGLTGNEAIDKMMSDLLKITKRHNVWLGLISHLRKTSGGKPFEEGQLAGLDDIKGSGSIKQISFDIIAFARNLVAEDEAERNTVNFRVLKSRFTGKTGDAGAAYYDPKTTRLTQAGGFSFEL